MSKKLENFTVYLAFQSFGEIGIRALDAEDAERRVRAILDTDREVLEGLIEDGRVFVECAGQSDEVAI